MNLLKRLRVLWRLSGAIDIDQEDKKSLVMQQGAMLKVPAEVPKLAQIIKRHTPAEKFLKDE